MSPLKKGRTKSVIKRNVETLVKEGKPQDQAVAIALEQAKTSTASPSLKKKKK